MVIMIVVVVVVIVMVIMMVVMLALVEMVAVVVIKVIAKILVLKDRGLSTKAILHSYIDVYRFDDNIRYLLVYLFVKE